MLESVSLITNKKYYIPSDTNDRWKIDEFIASNKGKKVVVVQGLGFVGAVMCLVVANAVAEEYAVIGVDLPGENSYWKIRSINDGVFPVIASDEKIELFYENAKRKGNFYATCDPYAYSLADVVIVDINLDVEKISRNDGQLESYDVDLSSFSRAIEVIAQRSKPGVLVLVETTVPPGTCEKVVKPIFNSTFKDRGFPDEFCLGHSYERVMPGPGYVDSIQNFYRVYSGIDAKSADAVEKFLKTIIYTSQYPLTRLHSTTASEMAKVLENSYRAMNIAFMAEWTGFAEEAEVNLFQVLDAIRLRPTHKNIMSPGLGVGGYCLPKDPLLASWARNKLFGSAEKLTQSETAVLINDQMPQHTFEVINKITDGKLNSLRIGLVGVSYLNNVGDTRYTPAGLLYDLLIENNAQVRYTDKYVPWWTEKNLYAESMEQLIAWRPQLLVLCTKHEYFLSDTLLNHFMKENESTLIVDAVNLLSADMVAFLSAKGKLCVIGRGDIKVDQNLS